MNEGWPWANRPPSQGGVLLQPKLSKNFLNAVLVLITTWLIRVLHTFGYCTDQRQEPVGCHGAIAVLWAEPSRRGGVWSRRQRYLNDRCDTE